MKLELVTRKQELAEKVNLQFNEVSEFFSEETLESMFLVQLIGGDGNSVASCGCQNNSAASCGCTNSVAGCGSGSGSGSGNSGSGSGNSGHGSGNGSGNKVNVGLCLD